MALSAHSPSQAARLSLRVLDAVAAHPDGITTKRLARVTGLPAVRLARLLPMLRREGSVEQLPEGVLVPGMVLLVGAGGGRAREEVREHRLQQALDSVRDSLDAAVHLGRHIDGELVIPLVSATPRRPVVHEWVAFRAAAHATAVGRCLLNQLDHDGRRDHLSRHRAARLTSRTITDQRVLLSSLDRQPATMPVRDLREYAVGTLCAAVPLPAGSRVGCLALSLPVCEAHRLRAAAEGLNAQATPRCCRWPCNACSAPHALPRPPAPPAAALPPAAARCAF